MSPASPDRRRRAAEAGLPILLAVTTLAWFGAWPGPRASCLLAAAAAVGALGCAWMACAPLRRPRPSAETWAVTAVAIAYRLPALLHPWGWVNTDGAYGALVALHLLQGVRPAPVFTEGASYQGTLKAHLAALGSALTGADDLSRMMVASSLALDLAFIAATMALARRLGGRAAAVAAGLYLALGPKFLTVFSLNCVGQYVDVLALGGAALALLAAALQGRTRCASMALFSIGALLGAAFWQQPVAVSYVGAAALALAAWREAGRARRWGWTAAGLVVGALPVLVWNVQHDWGTRDVLGAGRRA